MVGIDVLEPERLARALARTPGLRGRLFTEAELAYAATCARPEQHLAARFCAKEAVSKALRMPAFHPRDVEVLPGGAVVLHGAVAREAARRGVDAHVSLTHVATLAAAAASLTPRSSAIPPPRGGSALPRG